MQDRIMQGDRCSKDLHPRVSHSTNVWFRGECGRMSMGPSTLMTCASNDDSISGLPNSSHHTRQDWSHAEVGAASVDNSQPGLQTDVADSIHRHVGALDIRPKYLIKVFVSFFGKIESCRNMKNTNFRFFGTFLGILGCRQRETPRLAGTPSGSNHRSNDPKGPVPAEGPSHWRHEAERPASRPRDTGGKAKKWSPSPVCVIPF